ncbi:hypothetical protein P692DRAFT_20848839 [Suillus brevipes Sb2]|nr:hypothetical protein P692DRAFT_20848839 [Suillus brevipes Sb2]
MKDKSRRDILSRFSYKTTHPTEFVSVPIWPTQLRRREVRGDWEEITHPSGAVYHYNQKTMTYTEMNLRTCSDEQLQRLESWINASRTKLQLKNWFLVVDPILARGQEIYTYYCVDPANRIITWLEPVDGYILFQECTAAWHWNHKRLELEAQFWKHVEYFPFEIKIDPVDIRALQVQLSWYQALMLEKSTAASLFWNIDQMKEIASELSNAGTRLLLNLQRHHEYLNHHGQPEARLLRTHSLGERRDNLKSSHVIVGLAIAMLCIPLTVLKRLEGIYVDGLISGVDIRKFTDDFSAQAKAQATVASVIMAVDASILAIPGLGSQLATRALSQQFSSRIRSLDFAVRSTFISATWISYS